MNIKTKETQQNGFSIYSHSNTNSSSYHNFNYSFPIALNEERATLAKLIFHLNDVSSLLSLPEDYFYSPHNKDIFQAIQRLLEGSKNVTPLSVEQELLRFNIQFSSNGNRPYISDLLQEHIDSIHFTDDVSLISALQEANTRRKIIKACSTISKECADSTESLTNIYADIHGLLGTIEDPNDDTEAYPIQELSSSLLEYIDYVGNRTEDDHPTVETGLYDLDAITGGLQGGQLITLGARAGMGKSFASMIFADKIARSFNKDKSVLFFSAEMPTNEVCNRFLIRGANEYLHESLDNDQLNGRKPMTEETIGKLYRAAAEYNDVPLFFTDNPGGRLSTQSLESYCEKVNKQSPLGLIVVDYLQLLANTKGEVNMVYEIGKWSKCLKTLAKKYNCTVLSLAQISRGVESRQDKRPTMADLKASGEIEQDSDKVLLLYRDDYYKNQRHNSESDNLLEIIVAKNRQGAVGSTKVLFEPSKGIMRNLAKMSY